jgi:hypothetical protein
MANALRPSELFGLRWKCFSEAVSSMCASLVKMVESGLLSEEELRQMTIPTVVRTRQEFLVPFSAEGTWPRWSPQNRP